VWPRPRPGNIRLGFGGDLGYDADPGIFKGFFISYRDSYRHPRIKHGKVELSGCFLVFDLIDFFAAAVCSDIAGFRFVFAVYYISCVVVIY